MQEPRLYHEGILKLMQRCKKCVHLPRD